MKPLVLLLTLLALSSSVRAQHFELIANTEGRKTMSLDGQWQTIIDPLMGSSGSRSIRSRQESIYQHQIGMLK